MHSHGYITEPTYGFLFSNEQSLMYISAMTKMKFDPKYKYLTSCKIFCLFHS